MEEIIIIKLTIIIIIKECFRKGIWKQETKNVEGGKGVNKT